MSPFVVRDHCRHFSVLKKSLAFIGIPLILGYILVAKIRNIQLIILICFLILEILGYMLIQSLIVVRFSQHLNKIIKNLFLFWLIFRNLRRYTSVICFLQRCSRTTNFDSLSFFSFHLWTHDATWLINVDAKKYFGQLFTFLVCKKLLCATPTFCWEILWKMFLFIKRVEIESAFIGDFRGMSDQKWMPIYNIIRHTGSHFARITCMKQIIGLICTIYATKETNCHFQTLLLIY